MGKIPVRSSMRGLCPKNLTDPMGASIGGDTDTIAALSGMLSTPYNRGHDIPEDIIEYVLKVNSLVVDKYAAIVCDMNGKR